MVMFLVPPFYTLMTSLKSSAEISAQTGSPWIVHHPTLEHFWDRHILDSAQLVRFEPGIGASWVDVGSGAGLPGIVIACLVDISRLAVYNKLDALHHADINYKLIAASVACAFAGAYLGNRFLKKITIRFIQKLVAAMLLVFSLLLGAGIL